MSPRARDAMETTATVGAGGRVTLAAWLLLTFVLLFANREVIFSTPTHETGDFAVNALQITRAKHGAELYGNYSRFHFHHPGPAFFYVYAAGEWLLHDVARVVPSPGNAHVAAGILLQSGFFVLGLSLLAQLLDRWRTFLFGLVAGAWHFGQVDHAFTGIWPPEVLMMPFFAFIAAAAATAVGRLRALPWLVLAGSFLVHGHVAQPLFVVTLAIAVYWRGARVVSRGHSWRVGLSQSKAPHLAAAALLFLFLTPLLLDLALGAPNLRRILLHLGGDDGQGKSLLQSLLYFLGFTTYTRDPELLLREVNLSSLPLITANPIGFLLWLGSVSVFTVEALRRWRFRSDLTSGLRELWLYWAAASALCLVWGMLQAGPMYAFNGLFYYSLNLVAHVAAGSILLDRLRVPVGLTAAMLATTATVSGAFLLLRIPSERIDVAGERMRQAVQRALAADPYPDRPKFLVFPEHYWGHGAAVALALQRSGVSFWFEPELRFMFQARHTLAGTALADPDFPYSVWRFRPALAADSGILIDQDLGFAFQPEKLAPHGGEITFDHPDRPLPYVIAGMSTGVEGRAWTKDHHVVFRFVPEPADHDVEVRVHARPFVRPDRDPWQTVDIQFNGKPIATLRVEREGEFTFQISRELWNAQPIAHLYWHLPDAAAPMDYGWSLDARSLALELSSLRTMQAPGGAP